MSYIFGGDTELSPEAAQNRRRIAQQLMSGQRPAQSRMEGVNSGLQTLMGALANYQAGQAESAGRTDAADQHQALVKALTERQYARQSPGTAGPDSAPPQPSGTSGGRFNLEGLPGEIGNELLTRGYAPHHVAGILGNIRQESNFDTGAIGDNGNAFGLVQWNGPRREAYQSYAAEKGADPQDWRTQLDFLESEFQGSEAAAWEQIKATSDAGSAAGIASDAFWRPGIPHRDTRGLRKPVHGRLPARRRPAACRAEHAP